MAELLYVARGDMTLGPFTPHQVREFAASGKLRPTDTIWKDGMAKPELATKFKNLMPAGPIALAEDGPVTEVDAPTPSPDESSHPSGAETALAPSTTSHSDGQITLAASNSAMPAAEVDPSVQEQPGTEEKKLPPVPDKAAPKFHLVAVQGAVVVSQNGVSAHYKKKCITCGFVEAKQTNVRIIRGTTRTNFFCPKCKKTKPVELKGRL